MPKVLAVNISETKGVPKQEVEKGYFEVEHGLVGDAHAGEWHRQVSLLGVESVDKLRAAGLKDLTNGRFAENITTEGLILHELPIGTRLHIGETVMEVTQIGKTCHNSGCAIKRATGDCVMPREGIFARVIVPGWIKPGDEIKVQERDGQLPLI
ncbi:MAG: MOSC domain-containing protein [Peptococcaceae bacterium]|jgi:MOSC domain-containing protein YiiM|nr:MOSC domain-containing protein [Peptococcaceae bacterium]